MQAIMTKFIPATDTKGDRIKAQADRGSIMIPWPGTNVETAHIRAADALVDKFIAEDTKTYGSDPKTNPWGRRRAIGALPNGTFAHVFVEAR